MTLDLTPSSKSERSYDTSNSSEPVPSTPKLPFDPPRRRSSLAFSKIIDTPTAHELADTPQHVESSGEAQAPTPCNHISWKETIETPDQELNGVPRHSPKFERVFQAARANLQLDMHFAASPIGSIASRLPHLRQGATIISNQDNHDNQVNTPARMWRHSIIPNLFSSTLSDVREPLPDASPTLPTLLSRQSTNRPASLEPTSSGFASPLGDHTIDAETDDISLPPLPRSSSPQSESSGNAKLDQGLASRIQNEDGSDLTRPMTGLKVSNYFLRDDELVLAGEAPSPLVERLRRKPGHDHEISESNLKVPDNIFLSQSAKAAAECARAKRGLLNEIVEENKSTQIEGHITPASQIQACANHKGDCPDPQLHQYLATRPCPDPFAHVVSNTTEGFKSHIEAIRAQPRAWGNEYVATSGGPTDRIVPRIIGLRTTAAGSPMPFSRRNQSPTKYTERGHMERAFVPSTQPPPALLLDPKHHPHHVARHAQKPSEHFRPGWYYANESPFVQDREATNLYSFSTAAAKATGESAAPDQRIRDSYRTDTLTPLARPQGRFRKNGLAATLRAPGPAHYPNRGPPLHPSSQRTGKSQNRRYEPPQFENIQFRSSPPRPSTHYSTANVSRKRGANELGVSDFDVVDDDTARSTRPSIRTFQSEEIMQVDDQTREAVRLSLFGSVAPDDQQNEVKTMRELSPDVNIWRKGRSGETHHRKKRRPSYWDGDLEEVRMSPAGRAGIQSSPPISKRSVVAELETTSSYVGSVEINHDSVLEENEQVGSECHERDPAPEVDMTDAVA